MSPRRVLSLSWSAPRSSDHTDPEFPFQSSASAVRPSGRELHALAPAAPAPSLILVADTNSIGVPGPKIAAGQVKSVRWRRELATCPQRFDFVDPGLLRELADFAEPPFDCGERLIALGIGEGRRFESQRAGREILIRYVLLIRRRTACTATLKSSVSFRSAFLEAIGWSILWEDSRWIRSSRH